jgi:hypothetical protein
MCALPATRDRTFPLARRHAAFKLTRLEDGKSLAPVAIDSPYEFLVEGSPDLRLMREPRCSDVGIDAVIVVLSVCARLPNNVEVPTCGVGKATDPAR